MIIQYIKFLKRVGYCPAGTEVMVVTHDEGNLYYYDPIRRWVSIPEDQEGIEFEYLPIETSPPGEEGETDGQDDKD